jgi:hypothetical protein
VFYCCKQYDVCLVLNCLNKQIQKVDKQKAENIDFCEHTPRCDVVLLSYWLLVPSTFIFMGQGVQQNSLTLEYERDTTLRTVSNR